ncbi:MAG: WD40/YVTN/BNR-like repeat-containing protein [Terracidiphilus sp.]
MQMTTRTFLRLVAYAALIFATLGTVQAQRRGRNAGGEFGFRFVGPMVGNRVSAVAGIPGDPSTYYAGAASGGVWKSTDGGNRWTPIFDREPVAAIGALAVAPSDPNVVWAGTGEAWAIRDIDVTGDGVYKSTDAGKTWQHMGLDATGRIGRVVIDPRDENRVYVCALGRLGGPQQERGVYRTTDGGKTWDHVLFVDENTGCSGIGMDPENPRTLFAGMWQVSMHTWGEISGGPGSGVYVSHDSGTTWTHIVGHGLPKSPMGKIDVAVAPTDSNRVYALIETNEQGSMWRSDDGGEDWRVVSWDRTLIGRAGYYIRLAVSPSDENMVMVSNSSFLVSLDGGQTFEVREWGGDNHDIWWDPKDANRFAISYDEGLVITTVGGKGFHRVTLPIGQMYHVAVDDQIPYDVYSNMQDSTTMRGPSVPQGYEPGLGWDYGMGGCESGFTLPDPTDPNIVWASCYGDEVTRWDARTKEARSVSPWMHTLDSAPNQVKYRCHWTPPLAIDPFDHNTVYYGCQVVFKTSDEGQSWTVISPDLTTQNPAHNLSSGGLIGDNLGQFYGEVVFALAPSSVQKGLLWAGTDDGKVWNTRDGGAHWNDLTANIPGLPPLGTVTSIQPSFFDAGTAYLTVDAHLDDNRDPYIFKTTDFGKTWTSITGNLPKGPLAYVRNVSQDPNCKSLLFVGTGNALYYSLDQGGTWTHFDKGLPPSPVTWTVVQKRFHDLVVSTYGRGIYILDDITPLEEMAKQATTEDVRFFSPRPTYRLLHGESVFLDFALKTAPKEPVEIEILDAGQKPVRKLTAPGHEGINRIAWDMHYAGPRLIALRTIPPEDPHIWEEGRFRGRDSRPVTHWGMERIPTPMAAPGKYEARLTVDGKSFTEPVTILMDPKCAGTEADLEASVKLQLRIQDDVDKVSDMVNRIEWMRKQLGDVEKMLSADATEKQLSQDADAMDRKMQDVEYEMLSKPLAASDDKTYISAWKIYYNLLWMNGEIGSGAGDVAGGTDYKPTDVEVELTGQFEQQLAKAEVDYKNLMDKDVPAFNRTLGEHKVTPIVAAGAPDAAAAQP